MGGGGCRRAADRRAGGGAAGGDRRGGIGWLHLDGARLFLQAVYTGEDVATTAKPFDTVYVSLYKYFNASFGAILALLAAEKAF